MPVQRSRYRGTQIATPFNIEVINPAAAPFRRTDRDDVAFFGQISNSSPEHNRDTRMARCGDGETGSRDAAPPPPTQTDRGAQPHQPILPVRPGLPKKATHDYQRNGTTTLFAAFGGGHRHGHRPVLPTSRQGRIPRLPQEGRPCLRSASSTSCATTTTPTSTLISRLAGEKPKDCTAFHPNLRGSWLNLVEVFFSIITRQAIRAAPSTAQETQHRPPDLHHRMKRPLPRLRLDQNRRRNPQPLTGIFLTDFRCSTHGAIRRSPDSVTRHLRPDEVDGRGHRAG
jgi:hypothetical protein